MNTCCPGFLIDYDLLQTTQYTQDKKREEIPRRNTIFCVMEFLLCKTHPPNHGDYKEKHSKDLGISISCFVSLG